MTRLRDIRLPWDVQFEPAEPDALDPIGRYVSENRGYVNRNLIRRRLQEEEDRVNPPITSLPVPTSSPMGAPIARLASSLGGLKSRITAPLRPVGEAVSDIALEPAIPARTVRESVEATPVLGKALGRPSRRFGKVLEDVAEGLAFSQSDSPFTPTFEKQRPDLGEIAPSKAIEMAAEFGPSWTDFLTGGTSRALGLGLMAAGSLKDVGKGIEAARGAKKIAKELKAAEKLSPELKAWYHGTSVKGLKPENLTSELTREENLFGQGVYMTSDPEVAKSYGKARSRLKGEPTLYKATLGEHRAIDMDAPITDDVRSAMSDWAKHLDSEVAPDVDVALSVPETTPGRVYDTAAKALSEWSVNNRIPKYEVGEVLSGLVDRFRGLGYDALSYRGGVRTGKRAHEAVVLLDPSDVGGIGRRAPIRSFEEVAEELPVVDPGTVIPKTTKFSRFGGAIEPPDVTPPTPPQLTQPFPDIPGKGVSRPEVAFAQIARTPDDFLREIAGKQMVPREAAVGMADAARNLQMDTQVKANDGAAALDGLLRGLKALRGKDRVRVEKALATRLDFGVPTGSDDLDRIADGIDQWQRARFKEVADALEASGKPRPTERQFYLTHRNERFGDAIRKYEHDPNGAVDDVEALYRESKVESPGRDEIRKEVDRIYRERNAPSTGPSGRVASKSPHVEEARTLDVPGYVADVRRADFKAGDLVRTLEAYNQETAFRLADIKHFGAEGENFTNWHNAVGNESVKSYMREYRQQLLNALSDDPFVSETGWLMSALRSYEAANRLGRAAIANSMQTLVTTLPKSMNTIGLRGAVNYAQALGKSLPSLVDRGEALAAARRMGAVYDHSVADIAGIEHKGFMGGLADWQLKAFGFVPTERFNNTLSYHAGRLYGEDLAQAFMKGNKQAASEARRLLSASPELADRFVHEAATGTVSNDILDRMGFEFARSTQFRADPTTLPLKWVTPFGKTLFQFKGFGYQYNRFLLKEVFGPALERGEVRPLVAWLATAGTTTPLTIYGRKIAKDAAAMKQLFSDDPKERARFESALDADVTLQSLGLLGDAGMAAKRTFLPDEGQKSPWSRAMAIPEFAAGPAFSEPMRAVKEGVGWRRPADEMIASRLPIGPVVPTAEAAARAFDFGDVGLPARPTSQRVRLRDLPVRTP